MALTEKQKKFVDEYLIDLNATRAYMVAYPRVKKEEVAAANGSRMLRNDKVAEYVSERMKEREKRTEITQDRVIQELASIAFAKATDYATIQDGEIEIKNTEELNEEQIRAIAGIKEGKYGIEIKLNDKEKALELLGRHLGMFKDRVEISGLEEEQSKLSELLMQRKKRRDEK
jgi:phage terminase small subunit